jgi:hypothetical protein
VKGVPLYKIEWVIDLEYYEKHPDSQLHISCADYPDILSVIAHAQRHIFGIKAGSTAYFRD